MYRDANYFIAEYFISRGTVTKIYHEIEEEVKKGRYPKGSILRDTRMVRADTEVFKDFMLYRRALKTRNSRKYVPAYEG